jgi:hypothetical protein
VHSFLPGEVGLPKAAESAETGVVDQHFEARTDGDGLFDGAEAVFGGEVGGEGCDFGGEFTRDFIEAGTAPGDQDQVEAAPGELSSEGSADPSGGSGDECDGFEHCPL